MYFDNKIIILGVLFLVLIIYATFFKNKTENGRYITMFQYAGVDPPNPLVVPRPIVTKQFVKDGWNVDNVQSTRGLGQ